jgi:hypothetical protein
MSGWGRSVVNTLGGLRGVNTLGGNPGEKGKSIRYDYLNPISLLLPLDLLSNAGIVHALMDGVGPLTLTLCVPDPRSLVRHGCGYSGRTSPWSRALQVGVLPLLCPCL